MGIGFTGCTFGEHLCTIDDFTTVFHPEFGVCHPEKWVQQSKDVKATDSTLTVSYFTDATDSLGQQLPGIDRMSRVVVVPVGQFPWRDKALTASPGQHLELRMRYDDKVNRFSKPPDQACNQSEMNQTNCHSREPPGATAVNTYAVHKFIRHCGCLPSFLPIPVEFFPTYNYCFDDKTDLLSIESTEACYMRLMASISRYEMEARQLCLDMCERRSYAIRPVTYPWPGLTIDSATDFLHNSLGDWGVANLFYMDIRTKEVQARRSNLSANEMLEFTNELQNVERSLAKISIQALSDFGQEMTEEPSYTTKNLMADLGRIAAKKRISQEAAHRAEVAAGKPEPSRSPVHGEERESRKTAKQSSDKKRSAVLQGQNAGLKCTSCRQASLDWRGQTGAIEAAVLVAAEGGGWLVGQHPGAFLGRSSRHNMAL
uniref:Amiloride-sensitive sodium channel n=1 Tax=Macrostomum lignano TaxID=282301 RepID=A0A1I8FK83_9PLAT